MFALVEAAVSLDDAALADGGVRAPRPLPRAADAGLARRVLPGAHRASARTRGPRRRARRRRGRAPGACGRTGAGAREPSGHRDHTGRARRDPARPGRTRRPRPRRAAAHPGRRRGRAPRARHPCAPVVAPARAGRRPGRTRRRALRARRVALGAHDRLRAGDGATHRRHGVPRRAPGGTAHRDRGGCARRCPHHIGRAGGLRLERPRRPPPADGAARGRPRPGRGRRARRRGRALQRELDDIVAVARAATGKGGRSRCSTTPPSAPARRCRRRSGGRSPTSGGTRRASRAPSMRPSTPGTGAATSPGPGHPSAGWSARAEPRLRNRENRLSRTWHIGGTPRGHDCERAPSNRRHAPRGPAGRDRAPGDVRPRVGDPARTPSCRTTTGR